MSLDQEVHIKFVNKTDSGLTITAMNELSTHDGNGDDTYHVNSWWFWFFKIW